MKAAAVVANEDVQYQEVEELKKENDRYLELLRKADEVLGKHEE